MNWEKDRGKDECDCCDSEEFRHDVKQSLAGEFPGVGFPDVELDFGSTILMP